MLTRRASIEAMATTFDMTPPAVSFIASSGSAVPGSELLRRKLCIKFISTIANSV
jgi:hypothetical protein